MSRNRLLRGGLIGADPLQIEKLWSVIYQDTFWEGRADRGTERSRARAAGHQEEGAGSSGLGLQPGRAPALEEWVSGP